MSESNVIYEISQVFTDKNRIKNDMNEATNLVMEMFKKKYIDKLQTEATHYLTHAQQNPTKEIHLLRSLKPFMDETKHEHIDYMIDCFATMNALQRMQKELPLKKAVDVAPVEVAAAQAKSSTEDDNTDSVHSDGIYDLDHSCLVSGSATRKTTEPNMMGMLFLFMFGGINKLM